MHAGVPARSPWRPRQVRMERAEGRTRETISKEMEAVRAGMAEVAAAQMGKALVACTEWPRRVLGVEVWADRCGIPARHIGGSRVRSSPMRGETRHNPQRLHALLTNLFNVICRGVLHSEDCRAVHGGAPYRRPRSPVARSHSMSHGLACCSVRAAWDRAIRSREAAVMTDIQWFAFVHLPVAIMVILPLLAWADVRLIERVDRRSTVQAEGHHA
jgi:hypothetical protein